MAKLKVLCAYDAKLGLFHTPQFFTHLGMALRVWDETCNNPQAPMCKHPADFVLYEVAEFDEDTGLLQPLDQHRLIATALEAKHKPQSVLPFEASRAQG